LAAFFHPVNRRSAELGTQCRQRPAARIEHSHATLPVHHDGEVSQAAIAGEGDVEYVLSLL
jgi:hypothetical protein